MLPSQYIAKVNALGGAYAGLDWRSLNQIDGNESEIKRIAATLNAAWVHVLKSNSIDVDDYAAFLGKQGKGGKGTLLSAASLMISVMEKGENFITMYEIEDGKYWLLCVENGLPRISGISENTDFVGDLSEVIEFIKDTLSSYDQRGEIPFYTDVANIADALPFDISIVDVSLDQLAKKVNKGHRESSRFKRYFPYPIFKILISFVVLSILAGVYLFWYKSDENERLMAQQELQRQQAQRREELRSRINLAINTAPEAKRAVAAYIDALRTVPLFVGGWRFEKAFCANSGCTLHFKAQEFATWNSYVKNLPKGWLQPNLNGDFANISQEIPVSMHALSQRNADALLSQRELIYFFGNTAQTATSVGFKMNIEGTPTSVVGGPIEEWIPVSARYEINGPAYALKGLLKSFPNEFGVLGLEVDVASVQFKMNGEMYAKP